MRSKHKIKGAHSLPKRMLALLCNICFMMHLMPMEIFSVNAAETPKFLNSIKINATNKSTWADDGKYDATFHANLTNPDSKQSTFEIGTAGELAAFAVAVNEGKNFEGKTVKLTADIDLQGTAPKVAKPAVEGDATKYDLTISGDLYNVWVPIGNTYDKRFEGTFDGGGHEITNMVVNVNRGYAGLFGAASNATIRDVGIGSGSHIIGARHAGGISGGYGTITNCYNTGSVSSSSSPSSSHDYYYSYAGGISGRNATITDCYNTGSVSSSSHDSSFSSSSSSDSRAGGISGGYGTITNCYNTGSVSSSYYSSSYYSSYAGGISGGYGTITNCYNTGSVSSSSSSSHDDSSSYAGGISGSGLWITNCYNTGSVESVSTSGGACKGGVNGYGGTATNCFYDKVVVGNIGAVDGGDTGTAKGLPTAAMQGDEAKKNMAGFADATEDGKETGKKSLVV